MSCFQLLKLRNFFITLLVTCSVNAFSATINSPLLDDSPDTWQRMIPDLNNPVGSCSFVLNDEYLPCMAYNSSTGSQTGVIYAEFDGSVWNETLVADLTYQGGCKLLMAPGGYPQILYSNPSDDTFNYAWYDSSTWQIEVFWSYPGNGLDSKLDSQGQIHVVFTDSDNFVYYGTREDGWSFEQIGYATTWPVALALDSDDVPHVVWSNGGIVRHYWQTSSGWLSETITSNYLEGTAFAADQQNNLHLVIQGASNISYHKRTTSGWESEIIDSMSGDRCVLAVAADGTPHVAYDEEINSDLRYAVRQASGWYTVVISWEGYCGFSPSIQLDELENPWMCHSQSSNTEIIWWGQPTSYLTEKLIDITANHTPISISPNPITSTGAVNLDIPMAGFYTLSLFDLSGRKITTLLDSYLESSSYQLLLDIQNLPTGTVIAKLEGNGTFWTERMLVLKQ